MAWRLRLAPEKTNINFFRLQWITIGISMALVALVNFIFLGSLRAAFIPSIVAPICLLATFIVLAPLGFSLNLLTLLALVLAIGLVVDDAIVVTENIQRRLDHGEPPLVAAERGTRQVFFAVIATTVTLLAVFAPLLFLPGYVGRLFVELAAAIAAAVAFSAFLALSLYQIESNTRSAAVLGFVGAGGIGLVYAENMRLWNWDVVMFITLILVVIVMLMDKISAILRNKYIVGEEIPLYPKNH